MSKKSMTTYKNRHTRFGVSFPQAKHINNKNNQREIAIKKVLKSEVFMKKGTKKKGGYRSKIIVLQEKINKLKREYDDNFDKLHAKYNGFKDSVKYYTMGEHDRHHIGLKKIEALKDEEYLSYIEKEKKLMCRLNSLYRRVNKYFEEKARFYSK